MSKTVATEHPLFKKMLPKWTKCRDCIEGEEAVKEAGTKYLPRLDGMTNSDYPGADLQGAQVPVNTYEAYKMRAMFYAAAGRTVEGLEGMILRKEPDITWPEARRDIFDTIGVHGESIGEIIAEALEECIGLGRIGLMVDAPSVDNAPPSISTYDAESIIYWEEDVIEGKRRLVQVTLKEQKEYVKEDGTEDTINFFRVLKLGAPTPRTQDEAEMEVETFLAGFGLQLTDFEDGLIYFQELWVEVQDGEQQAPGERYKLLEVTIPTMMGGRYLRTIPFVFVNSASTKTKPNKPPILDLVNVNLSHYRNSADLEHGRHFTALPTAWASGFDVKQSLVIGSAVAWVTEEPGARAGYLEFSGQGLGHLQTGMDKKEKLMAVLGARLLEEQKAGVEAAEAVKLRHAGEQSSLGKISHYVSEGLSRCLTIVADWLGMPNPDKVRIKLNKDFNLAGIESDLLQNLLLALQAGAISFETFFWNLKRGEVIPDGIDMESEWKKIEEGLPNSPSIVEDEGSTTNESDVTESSDDDEEDEDESEDSADSEDSSNA